MQAIEYVHKSQLNTIKRCSRQLYYKDILKIKPKFVNESALAGQAFHNFAEQIYLSDKKDKWDDWKYWLNYWIEDFNKRKAQCLADDTEVNTVEDIKAEDFAEMIVEFLKQPYNKFAEPVLIEAPFRFYIQNGKKKYWFEGRIDQLLKIDIKHLVPYFAKDLGNIQLQYGDNKNIKQYIYIHRDIKSGNRKAMSEIGLTIDDNLTVYSYALAFGLFDLHNTGNYTKRIHHIPFAHALYYVRDHLKYKKNTEKNSKGDYKGQAMYFTKKNYDDLKMAESELINLHKKINSGIYTRDGGANNLCDKFCGYKDICLHDFKNYG